jgi:hypothetical protein
LDGSAAHLASVEFCYGAGTGTAGSGNQKQTASMTITEATVYELNEPAAATAGGGAPPYAHKQLLDETLDLTNGSNCQTVKPAAPPSIDPSGYLLFQLFATFNASAGYHDPSDNYIQSPLNTASAPLTLGRITVTYSP